MLSLKIKVIVSDGSTRNSKVAHIFNRKLLRSVLIRTFFFFLDYVIIVHTTILLKSDSITFLNIKKFTVYYRPMFSASQTENKQFFPSSTAVQRKSKEKTHF